MFQKWLKAIEIYGDKRMLTMILLGFSSGFPFLLVFGTFSLWLKDAGVSLAAIGLFSLAKAPVVWYAYLQKKRLAKHCGRTPSLTDIGHSGLYKVRSETSHWKIQDFTTLKKPPYPGALWIRSATPSQPGDITRVIRSLPNQNWQKCWAAGEIPCEKPSKFW